MTEFEINKIKNQTLRTIAETVDKTSADSKTKGNGKIDSNELSVFFDAAAETMQKDKSAAEEVTSLFARQRISTKEEGFA